MATRGALHRTCADPVQVSKDPAVHLWIDIGHPSLDGIVGTHTGHANLADAAAVIVGGLDIQRKETKWPLRKGRDASLMDGRRLARNRQSRTGSRAKEPLALPFGGC